MSARVVIVAAALALVACAGRAPGEDDAPFTRAPALDEAELTSAAGLADSHPDAADSQSGVNCMECHSARGDGPGLFSVGATLWTGDAAADGLAPLAGAIVQLRTAPFGGGDVVVELEADDLGNVYTTEPIDFFASSLFPHVIHDGATLSMPFPTNSGACNMCHQPGGSLPLVLP